MLLDIHRTMTQREFADLVGVSQPTVSKLVAEAILLRGASAEQWLRAYLGHLRARAEERGDELQIAEQRARLASEQADRIAMQNVVARRNLAPVAVIDRMMATIVDRASALLLDVPASIERRAPTMAAEALEIIAAEIGRVDAVLRTAPEEVRE